MTDPLKLYRFLLKLYPARFREEYGTPLEQQFSDEYREAGGGLARLTVWMRWSSGASCGRICATASGSIRGVRA